MFGEVFDANPQFMSTYTTKGALQATLDFGFQQSAVAYAKGDPGTKLQDFYANDDYYTDADSNAYQLPTFLGNHDMGRVGTFLKQGGASGQDLLARDELAHSLMFLTRGSRSFTTATSRGSPAAAVTRTPAGHVRHQGRPVRRRTGS
jgi:glycosidase